MGTYSSSYCNHLLPALMGSEPRYNISPGSPSHFTPQPPTSYLLEYY